MTSAHILERARRGQAEAIAFLLNQRLRPKGVRVVAEQANGHLKILLEAPQVPPQERAVIYLKTALSRLNSEALHTLMVYGRQRGELVPAWYEEVDLRPPAIAAAPAAPPLAAAAGPYQPPTAKSWWQWTSANTLAVLLVIVGGWLLGGSSFWAAQHVSPVLAWGLGGLVGILGGCTLLAEVQTRVLAAYLPRPGGWRRATLAGLLLGAPVTLVVGPGLLAGVFLLLHGAAHVDLDQTPLADLDLSGWQTLQSTFGPWPSAIAVVAAALVAVSGILLPLMLQMGVLSRRVRSQRLSLWVMANILAWLVSPLVGGLVGLLSGSILLVILVGLMSLLPLAEPAKSTLAALVAMGGLSAAILIGCALVFNAITGWALVSILRDGLRDGLGPTAEGDHQTPSPRTSPGRCRRGQLRRFPEGPDNRGPVSV